MTVGELIALLSKYPPSLLIVIQEDIDAPEGEYDTIEAHAQDDELILSII